MSRKFKWLQLQSTALRMEDEIGASTVIDNAKTLCRQAVFSTGIGNSLRYRQIMAPIAAQKICWPLIFQQLNTSGAADFSDVVTVVCMQIGITFDPLSGPLNREQRFCVVCGSNTAEDCPGHCAIRDRFTSTALFWGPSPTVS